MWLKDLSNYLKNSATQQSILNGATVNKKMDPLVKNVLSDMDILISDLKRTVYSNMAAISTQYAKSTSLTNLFKLYLKPTSSNTMSLDPINNMIVALSKDTQVVVKSGLNTILVNFDGLRRNLATEMLLVTTNLNTALEQVKAKSFYADSNIQEFLTSTYQPLDNALLDYNVQFSNVVNKELFEKTLTFVYKIDSIVTQATQQIAAMGETLVLSTAQGLTSKDAKIFKCSADNFQPNMIWMQDSIVATSNCMAGITPALKDLTSSINSIFSGYGNRNIETFMVAIKCFDNPPATRLSCIHTTITKIFEFQTTITEGATT